jgi:hypothetical protein
MLSDQRVLIILLLRFWAGSFLAWRGPHEEAMCYARKALLTVHNSHRGELF